MKFQVGSKFRLTKEALENYGIDRAGIHTVRAAYDHYAPFSACKNDPTGHPGFERSAGTPLYASDLPFDVYEWEMSKA